MSHENDTCETKVVDLEMRFRLIHPGVFAKGYSALRDRPIVEITRPFWLGIYPVTQKVYEAVMGENPSKFKGENHPVEEVSWEDAQLFCKKLNRWRSSEMTYRLPTEAEWEYACRAGTTTEHFFGNDETQLGEYAWFKENSNRSTHPVGQKKPNPWSLCDMLGNVGEWCQDLFFCQDLFGDYAPHFRVFRGGGWESPAVVCQSWNRCEFPHWEHAHFLGFRLAADPPRK